MGESWDSSRTVPRSYLATLLPVFMILYFLGCHEHAGIKNRDVFLLGRGYVLPFPDVGVVYLG